MTTSFSAQISGFTKRARENAESVIRGSAEDLFSLATRRQASIKETGSFREGFVPVDTGHLVGNSEVHVNGASTSKGSPAAGSPPDFALGLAGMTLGDTVSLSFNAEYARRIEYGFTGTDSKGRTYNTPGRFFVRNAVLQWQPIVDQNAAQF